MTKYDPLYRYLDGIAQDLSEVTLSFAEIERIIGEPLPPSACKHDAWWSNEIGGRHVQAHAWLDAGWRVVAVDLAAGCVDFERATSTRP